MAKRKFDESIIADIKGAAADSYLDNVKMIKIEDIVMNNDNFYELSDIEVLASDIERQGLIHNLAVEKQNAMGKYLLISGHRRLTAIKLLQERGKWTSGTVPCLVSTVEKSADEHRLDLIMLNHSQRKYSDADLFREHEELRKIFKNLESTGEKIDGRMREVIAEKLNISAAQVGKIENIKNNATPQVIEAVEQGEISISVANEIAKCDEEQQKEIIASKPKSEIKSAEVKAQREKKAKPKKEKSSAEKSSGAVLFSESEINFLRTNYTSLGLDYLCQRKQGNDRKLVESIIKKIKGDY